MGSWVTPEKFAAQVILNVCDLPDYNSPDDQPDLLQCTVKELEACVIRAFEHFDPDAQAAAQKSEPEYQAHLKWARDTVSKVVIPPAADGGGKHER